MSRTRSESSELTEPFSLSLPKHPRGNTSISTLKAHLHHCEALLTRNFTPRFLRFLEEWKKMIQTAQDNPSEDPDKRITIWKDTVESYVEKVEAGMAVPTNHFEELQHLRLNKFLLDYSDYFKSDLARLRTQNQFQKSAWNSCFQNWGQIVHRLSSSDREISLTDRDLKVELAAAANELGCTYELLIFQIETYAERNKIAHSDVTSFISTRAWGLLAYKLIRDRRSLPLLIPPSRSATLKSWEEVLDRVQERFFTALRSEPFHYQLSEYAIALDLEAESKQEARRASAEGERKAQELKTRAQEKRERKKQAKEERKLEKRKISEGKLREVSGNKEPPTKKGCGGETDDESKKVIEALSLGEQRDLEEEMFEDVL